MKRSATLFLLLLFVLAFEGKSQIIAEEPYAVPIEKAKFLIKEWRENQPIPGVQVAVMKEGRIIWSEGFGYANLEQLVPLTPHTKMRIGSVSKTFTSAAIGKLYEEGLLNLDAPVQEYVSYFPEKRYPITTRQVAGHLAGIRHYRDNEFLMNKYFPTVKEGIAIFADDTLLFKPGSDYHYSSYGYNLVSAVVEGASGQDFLSYMEKEVFEPLLMNETTADYNERIIPYRTAYYALKDDSIFINAPYVDNSYKWAGGGFLSTTEDIVKFGNAFLNEDYLKEETIKILWESQKTADEKPTNYGIGWVSGENKDFGQWYGHSGGSVGGTTQFIVYPEQNLVLAMMVNSNARYGDLHHQVAALFLAEGTETK